MSFQLFFYNIISFWFIFDFCFVYLKQGRRLGAKLLIRPGIQTAVNLLDAFYLVPALLSVLMEEHCRLQTHFSGIGIGSIIIFTSHVFYWYVLQLLGHYYSADIAVFEKHRIIEAGWYKTMRHPQYLANFISYIGLAICFHDFVIQIMIIIFSACNFYLKIRLEEQALCKAWGSTYKAYQLRTYKILPYIY